MQERGGDMDCKSIITFEPSALSEEWKTVAEQTRELFVDGLHIVVNHLVDDYLLKCFLRPVYIIGNPDMSGDSAVFLLFACVCPQWELLLHRELTMLQLTIEIDAVVLLESRSYVFFRDSIHYMSSVHDDALGTKVWVYDDLNTFVVGAAWMTG